MSVSLTVMTFNLLEDQLEDSPNSWSKRRDLCVSVITSYSPMILCTQQGYCFFVSVCGSCCLLIWVVFEFRVGRGFWFFEDLIVFLFSFWCVACIECWICNLICFCDFWIQVSNHSWIIFNSVCQVWFAFQALILNLLKCLNLNMEGFGWFANVEDMFEDWVVLVNVMVCCRVSELGKCILCLN